MSNDKKPDFSNVQSGVKSTEQISDKPDFSNVQSKVTSTEQVGGGGGAGEQSYTVVSGDSLSRIAKHFYGRGGQWHAIFAANRDLIDDPDKIFPGQVLTIPAIDTDDDAE
jgi:nucleoid-associated protein YgaU